jgi:CheY-like chemotaxis protein
MRNRFRKKSGRIAPEPVRVGAPTQGRRVRDDAMPCVLIVEDDPDIREFMQFLLSASGYETMTAANGEEALRRMKERRPCMVLLDLMMPVMDGFDFRARQLEDPALAPVPVLCLTAMFDPAYVTERLSVPCLNKPVSVDRLLMEVEERCQPR